MSCCTSRCMNKFTIEEIEEARNWYWSMPGKRQRSFILQSIRTSNNNIMTVESKQLCEAAWKSLYGVGDRRYREIKKGHTFKVPPETTRFQAPSRRFLQAKTWLDGYVSLVSEKQPNKDELHLPSCLSKGSVYSSYVDNITVGKEVPLSISAFKEMWLKEFGHVKISKGKGSHFQCTHCNNYKKSLLQPTACRYNQAEVLQMKREHLNLQTVCRQKYYKHIKKSKANPAKYCSLIIDNMDSAKTRLPRFTTNVKADVHLNTLQHHVTAVKCHSINKTFVYTWTDAFRSDCNITINCLLHSLTEVIKENNDAMPETLYIQADNSGKDNKNNFILVFLGSLVALKIFKNIKLSFLMVGHTHEDVDQVFSRIGFQLLKVNAPTLPKLQEAIVQSTTPAPEVEHLASLWDMRAICDAAAYRLTGFQQVHHFVFHIVSDHVEMRYKDWPNEAEYQVMDFTDFIVDLHRPSIVQISDKVGSLVVDVRKSLPTYCDAGRLEASEVEWWEGYLFDIERNTRKRPVTPLVETLPEYRLFRPLQDTTNAITAMEAHKEKTRKRSVIKKVKKRK